MKNIELRIRNQTGNGPGFVTLTNAEAEELLEYFNDVIDLRETLRETNQVVISLERELQSMCRAFKDLEQELADVKYEARFL